MAIMLAAEKGVTIDCHVSSLPGWKMLYSEEVLRGDFRDCEFLLMEETETLLPEGPFHQGKANVIRLIARKKTGNEISSQYGRSLDSLESME